MDMLKATSKYHLLDKLSKSCLVLFLILWCINLSVLNVNGQDEVPVDGNNTNVTNSTTEISINNTVTTEVSPNSDVTEQTVDSNVTDSNITTISNSTEWDPTSNSTEISSTTPEPSNALTPWNKNSSLLLTVISMILFTSFTCFVQA